jgi:hypothetical protein
VSLDSRYAKRFDPTDYDNATNNNNDAHYAVLHGGPENLNLHHRWVDFDRIRNQKNDFCRDYGYRYREEDLYNFKAYAWQQYNKFTQGKNAKNMWVEDARRFGRNV